MNVGVAVNVEVAGNVSVAVNVSVVVNIEIAVNAGVAANMSSHKCRSSSECTKSVGSVSIPMKTFTALPIGTLCCSVARKIHFFCNNFNKNKMIT